MSRSYLEFRCSELGDSSWKRTLSTLDLKEYKEPVLIMEERHYKNGYFNSPECKIGKMTSWHENAII